MIKLTTFLAGCALFGTARGAAVTSAAVCTTEACVREGAAIKLRLDTTVDPCTDMYQFSCGSWLNKTAIPPGKQSIDLMNYGAMYNARDFLENFDGSDNPMWPTIKTYYNTCMDAKTIAGLGASPLQPYLDQLSKLIPSGAIGDNDLTKAIIYLNDLGMLTLLTAYANKPDEIVFLQYQKRLDRTYKSDPEKMQVNIATLLKTVLGDSSIKWDHDNFDEIAAEQVKFSQLLSAITVANTTKEISGNAINRLGGGLVDMPALLKSFDLKNLTKVTVPDEQYFAKIMALVKKQSPRVIKYFLLLDLIVEASGFLGDKFSDAYNAFWHIFFYTNPKHRKHADFCTQTTTLPFDIAIRQSYNKYLNIKPEDVEIGKDMTDRIRKQFARRIEKASWLGPVQKSALLVKLDKLKNFMTISKKLTDNDFIKSIYSSLKIGTSSHFENGMNIFRLLEKFYMKDPSNSKLESMIYPYFANAYYEKDSIHILSRLYAEASFHASNSAANRYSNIGATIGHEIMHGFTKPRLGSAANFDNKGWDSSGYDALTQCFVDQYDQFKFTSIPDRVDGKNTLSENLPDNSGFQLAWDAWKNETAGMQPTVLAGLTEYSEDQLFFIRFGQSWCQKASASYEKRLVGDVHAPAKARVNGVSMNSDEFKNAFKCKKNAPMNPDKKCKLY